MNNEKLTVVEQVESDEEVAALPDRVKVLRLYLFCAAAYEKGLREMGLVDVPGLMTLVGKHFIDFDKATEDRVGRPSGFVNGGGLRQGELDLDNLPEEVLAAAYRQRNRKYKKTARDKAKKSGAKPGQAARTTAGGVPVTASGNPLPKKPHERAAARAEVQAWLLERGNMVGQLPKNELWKFIHFFDHRSGKSARQMADEMQVPHGTWDYWRFGRGNPGSGNETKVRRWLEMEVAQYRNGHTDSLADVPVAESRQPEATS